MRLSAFSYEFGSSVQREFLDVQSPIVMQQTSDFCEFIDMRMSWYLSSLSDQHASGAKDSTPTDQQSGAYPLLSSARRGIYPRKFWNTIRNFPHDRAIEPELPSFASFSPDRDTAIDCDVYDPSYFLPCLLHVLGVHGLLVVDTVPPSSVAMDEDANVASSGAVSRISRLATLLSNSGAIALTITCCSSADEGVRQMAYSCLDSFHNLLGFAEGFRERQQARLLLDSMREGINAQYAHLTFHRAISCKRIPGYHQTIKQHV